MKRRALKRLLITLGVTAGVIVASAAPASAAVNHCDVRLRKT